MVNVQPQMLQFYEVIKLKHFEENSVLREKRDRILDRLDKGLRVVFASQGIEPLEYETFGQGGYEIGIGTKPINGDYDIDVGISFKIAKNNYPDPVEVKEWVYLALATHTKRVEIRRSCVTVFYQEEGEPLYHVDLAVYSDKDCNPDGKMYLAKGKLNSSEDYKTWEESDPQGLLELIKNRFSDKDDDLQFRRTICYLKRWKNLKFDIDGSAAPIGIGITIAAYHWFTTIKTVKSFENTAKYDDLEALRCFISNMLAQFQYLNFSGSVAERLIVTLPVVPYSDLFEKMTNIQMAYFKQKLTNLLDAIREAQEKADPVEACKILQQQFGEDFPIPSCEETAQKRPPAIISSSASA